MVDKKVVNKHIYRMLLPMVLENILVVSASMVTAAMVGRLDTIAISAQGISGRILGIYFSVFKGLSIGVTVLSAIYFGEGSKDKTRGVLRQAFLTIIPLCIAAAVAIFVFAEQFTLILTDDPILIQQAVAYIRLLSCLLPFLAATFYVTAAFQAQGNTKVPMVIAAIINVVNIALGWLLIFGNAGAPELGLTGACIALGTSYTVGAIVGLAWLYMPKVGFFADMPAEPLFKVNKKDLKEIFTIGLPAAVENVLWNLATIIISRIIISYSADHYAAYQLGLNAEGVCEMLSIGFVTAATALSATAIGRKDDALYRTYFAQLSKICIAVSVLCTAILFFGNTFLMSLLTDKQNLIEIGAKYLFAMGVTQIPMNLNKIHNGFLRSSGYKYAPAVISLFGLWGIRVVFCYIAGTILHLPIEFIWASIAFDLIARFFICYVYLKKKNVLNAVQNLATQEA